MIKVALGFISGSITSLILYLAVTGFSYYELALVPLNDFPGTIEVKSIYGGVNFIEGRIDINFKPDDPGLHKIDIANFSAGGIPLYSPEAPWSPLYKIIEITDKNKARIYISLPWEEGDKIDFITFDGGRSWEKSD